MKRKILLFTTALLAAMLLACLGAVSVSAQDGDPIIIDFGDQSTGYISGKPWWVDLDQGVNAGKYTLTEVKDTTALRLDKDASTAGMFHIMFEFKNPATIPADYKYIRFTYMTDSTQNGKLIFQNFGATSDYFVCADNISVSGGEWVRTNAIKITDTTLQRLNTPQHVLIKFDTADANATYYLKELAFFKTEEDAYKYYGDKAAEKVVTESKMSFGAAGNAFVREEEVSYGKSTFNDATGALDITYCSVDTNMAFGSALSRYMAKIKFTNPRSIEADQKYVRIFYSAKHPAGVSTAELALRNDRTGNFVSVTTDLKDTNGEFVLTPTFEIPADFVDRFGGYNGVTANHVSLGVSTPKDGGVYSIKALYFFATKEAADAFVPKTKEPSLITINGNNIDLYQIVIAEDASYRDERAASALKQQVSVVSGVNLPIVKDTDAKSLYEILVGRSNRELSYAFMADYEDGIDYAKRFYFDVVGNTLVLTAGSPAALVSAIDFFNVNHLYKGNDNAPTEIVLDSASCKNTGILGVLGNATDWAPTKNVDAPATFTVDFNEDKGYFVEHGLNSGNFKVENGVLNGSAKATAISYMQVYEKNTVATAEFKFANAGAAADFGILARYVGTDAFIKGGYDFTKGEWYISFREGADFYEIVCASAAEALDPAKTYTVALKVDDKAAALSVNGKEILTADGINHVTPGRPGVFAENIDIAVDNFALTSLSGTGTVIPGVIHTHFSDAGSMYNSSVTFIEMKDGSINAGDFKSVDGGKTWTNTGTWTKTNTVDHFIRLNDGRLFNVAYANSGFNAYISDDEGKTWVKQGQIHASKYPGYDNIAGGNQNDKVTQGASGRIYYSANYEATTDVTFPDGVDRIVFCEFYFSDDFGKTWTKSDTSSFEIVGNEQAYKFGECKLIECADGAVRVYCSWSDYGCIVYSESTDGCKTFGPLQMLTAPGTDNEFFRCARSSMQLTRDMYGETDTTYYMVWVNAFDHKFLTGPKTGVNMPRNGLSLAKSTDGKNWEYLGDIWRWESAYMNGGMMLNHIVNPSIATSKDAILVGTGLSEFMPREGDPTGGHGAQRQHVWAIERTALENSFSFADVEPLYDFTDVTTADSYYNAVKFMVDKGLFNGTSATTFSPNVTLTRSMFVTVLGRLDGADVSAYTVPTFSDVKAGEWYTSYVEWAAANAIVNGIGSGKYGPANEVSIEQVCVMLARYANSAPAAVVSGKTLADFTDASAISTWATDGVKWAVENGIYTGSGLTLNPTAPASRALVAVMFNNYVNAYAK